MNERYTAIVYCNQEQIAIQAGNDIEQLQTWMLIQVNGYFGDIHGEVVDNKTKKIVKTFRKCAIE